VGRVPMNSFFEHHKDSIRWHYGCFDRILLLVSPLPDNVGRRVAFVSSDHEDASATVAALAESLGFAAIEVGKIAEGGRSIQARAPLVFQNLIKYPL
jgi:predicted dinucleotide-binding enzyme